VYISVSFGFVFSTLASDWLGRLYSCDIFCVEKFHLERPLKSYYCIGLLYVF